jgi:hypothetical protein
MDSARKEFDAIFNDWINDVSWTDIYQNIIDWANKHKDSIQSKKEIENILTRATEGEEGKILVEDFIYGLRYVNLRLEFKHEPTVKRYS